MTDLGSELAEPVELARVDIVGERGGREVEVNGLTGIDGSLYLLDRSGHGIGGRGAQPATEQREDDVRLVDPLSVDEGLGMTAEERQQSIFRIDSEAVYASGSEIRTRRWTWRQSERGKITEATKAILFPIDGFSDVNAAEVQAAADELVALLHKYFGDSIEIETGTVTKDHPRFDFFL